MSKAVKGKIKKILASTGRVLFAALKKGAEHGGKAALVVVFAALSSDTFSEQTVIQAVIVVGMAVTGALHGAFAQLKIETVPATKLTAATPIG